MEANWLEIKRFLNDYKKNVVIGATVIAIMFTIFIYLVSTFKEDAQNEEKEDFEVGTEELLNEAQPAYFQIFVEYEDGTSYGNHAIINQYFNLSSIKEKIKKDTGIDIQSIEQEVFLDDESDEIEIINVTRNDSSYLITTTINLGNEQDNLTIAEYYYNLLDSEDFSILQDKKTYVFQEPMLAEKSKLELDIKKLEEKRKESEEYPLVKKVIMHSKDFLVGFLLGVVLMIGIYLLKELFGITLNYSFTYDLDENDRFILYDKILKNEKIVSQFVVAPFGNHKLILSEIKIADKDMHLFTANEQVVTKDREKELTLLDESKSLTELNLSDQITEIIIVIYPNITTRKWYRTQKWLAEINGLPTKVIQINQ